MPDLIPFSFDDHLVRVLRDENGNPLFVAKDVALALGYQWSGIRNIQHVPEEWRGVESVSTPSGAQDMHVLTEQGLYFFLGRSDKPAALPFQKWTAGEVLPALREMRAEDHDDLPQLVENKGGVPMTTSLRVAAAFDKQHKDVLRAIRGLDCSEEFNGRNFAPVEFIDAKGEKRPAYDMTRDGFSFLVMGFTGKKAAAWKERFLEAFNFMERTILEGRAHKTQASQAPWAAPAPEESLRLKPALRTTAMNTAVQVAKMAGGDEAEVDRLYVKYCLMLSPPPPRLAGDTSRPASDPAEQMLHEWMDIHVEEASFEEKVRSRDLYLSFRVYCKRNRLRRPISQRWFSSHFNEHFDKIKSGNMYFIGLRLLDGNQA